MKNNWKEKLYVIIFEADTPAGKFFDIALLYAILLSILAVMLESVNEIQRDYGFFLRIVEWIFTAVFTIEYIIRILASPKKRGYVFSFFGIIDLLAIIPTYLAFFLVGGQVLVVIRSLRLLRVFRILKLNRYLGAASVISSALVASRAKILVFLFAVLNLVVIMGTIMYLIEADQNSGFTSIPRSIYWAIVTLTTVGYGDITPSTFLGQFVASIIMIMGYAIIAVPTGIVTSELAKENRLRNTECKNCGSNDHLNKALYCQNCGEKL
ncbi:MAG: ion transporter [Bacteroidota bacterium]